MALHASRRCTGRGCLGGHSDKAYQWDNDSRESVRCRITVLAAAYLCSHSHASRIPSVGSQDRFLVEAARVFCFVHPRSMERAMYRVTVLLVHLGGISERLHRRSYRRPYVLREASTRHPRSRSLYK